jgi:hypothetical protein
MTKLNRAKRRESRNLMTHRGDTKRMLDILLAFDRSMVEISMGLYNVPRRDRALMREQNRRLHRALRNHVPRLVE